MHSVEERGSLGRAEQEMVVQSRSSRGDPQRPGVSSEIPQRESCQPTPDTSKLVLVANFPSNFLQRERQRSSKIPQRESCQPTPATSKLVLVANFVSNFLQRARVHRDELVTGRSRSASLLSEIAAAVERLERHRIEENPDAPFLII